MKQKDINYLEAKQFHDKLIKFWMAKDIPESETEKVFSIIMNVAILAELLANEGETTTKSMIINYSLSIGYTQIAVNKFIKDNSISRNTIEKN